MRSSFKFSIYPIIFIIGLTFASCESRNDVFHRFNEVPKVYVSTQSGNFSDKVSETSMLLRHGESKTIYFDYEDDYIQKGISVEYAIFSDQEIPDYINCTLDTEGRRLMLRDMLPVTTLNEKVIKLSVKICVTDYYGDKGVAVIDLSNCDNRAPETSIVLERIQNMEYVINASGSVDSDGDEIVAYEYLIDGEIMAMSAGYEDSNNPNSLFNPGMAAKRGTYIISTPLNAVKHAFQTTGTHTIRVRAKDSLGLWSSWKTISADI